MTGDIDPDGLTRDSGSHRLGAASALALPSLLALATYVLWSTPMVWPIKIFVVFLHELSHGLAAILTGGSIVRIELSSAEGGLCVTSGGWRFLVLSAGYLGSLTWGAFLLLVSVRTRRDRAVVGSIGLILLLVTGFWIRTLFGFVWGLSAGSALIVAAFRLPEAFSDLILKTLGVVSILYAIWDIVSDTISRTVPGSDAHALGELTGIPGGVWGVSWIGVSVLVVVATLRASIRSTPDRA